MLRRVLRPSPLAAAVGVALGLALFLLLLGTAVARFAPPQDLPWTPLRLDQPVGLATGFKFALASVDAGRCRAVLSEGGVRFTRAPDRGLGACEHRDVVRLQSGVIPLSPAAPPMTCREALAYAFWTRHAVQAAARAELGEPVARIEHYGTYACRPIAGGAMMSQHAKANALDVAAFRTVSGQRISVLKDFRDGPRGRFLRRARDGACPWFTAVLSPDFNPAHRDHFHLDRGMYGRCR